MGKIKQKLYDWKDRLRDRHMLTLVVTLVSIIVIMGVFIYKKQTEYRQVMENQYNMAFFELVDYVGNVENFLAKSLISTTPEQGVENLTNVWREANLATSYLAGIPVSSNELSNTAKFLNQVSDYSYSLSRKNMYHESLTQEDLDNLKQLHEYSVELENTLNQLSADMMDGRINWGELTKKGTVAFATEVGNITQDSFKAIEDNFQRYAGLIYDGAFSEHITNAEKKGLTGEDVTENQAKEVALNLIGNDKPINSNGLISNGDIEVYDFYSKQDDRTIHLAVSKKGGHIVLMNENRDVGAEVLLQEQANEKGKEFLNEHGFPNMKETYYLKQSGIVTINYAYIQDDVIMYPDLIKLKIALDNGEVIGMETTGYLNSHHERELATPKISIEKAKQTLNKNLEIMSEGLAVIPTEWRTELLCYEFKGKVDGKEFLVYINSENGREEDILVIINTPNGTLTM